MVACPPLSCSWIPPAPGRNTNRQMPNTITTSKHIVTSLLIGYGAVAVTLPSVWLTVAVEILVPSEVPFVPTAGPTRVPATNMAAPPSSTVNKHAITNFPTWPHPLVFYFCDFESSIYQVSFVSSHFTRFITFHSFSFASFASFKRILYPQLRLIARRSRRRSQLAAHGVQRSAGHQHRKQYGNHQLGHPLTPAFPIISLRSLSSAAPRS